MDFVNEFKAAANMKISYNGSEIDNLKLNGSSRAWSEVERCQSEMNSRGTGNDPFSSGGDDPFATGGGQTKNSTSK